jgi:beta-1,2-mannobiose phosphorylase / 1,2-beta-oligomannan phosphorylase
VISIASEADRETRPHVLLGAAPVATRLEENPLIVPAHVPPTRPDMEVVCAFNPAAVRHGDEVVLLLRVAERPRLGAEPAPDACLLDISGPEPQFQPLDRDIPTDGLIGLALFNPDGDPPGIVSGYVRRDLPGLDLHDPRAVSYLKQSFLSQISHLRVARSRDGIHFAIDSEPAITPTTLLEEYGCEDARITPLEGRYVITYVSVSRLGITTSLASTSDFHSFTREGIIFLGDHKDVVLFPERIGGRYWALTRPMPSSFAKIHGIWLANSPDLTHWGDHHLLALPRPGFWDERRTGGLVLYHGVDATNRYCMGGLLLDGDDPTRVLARSPEPILSPDAPFERAGFYGNVVLSCGHVGLDARNRRIRLYYGAADSVTAAADFDTEEIIASLR